MNNTVNILGDILPEIKQELAKEIVAQINLNELAIQLYPLLQKIDKRNPKRIIEKHKEYLQRVFATQNNIVNGLYISNKKER